MGKAYLELSLRGETMDVGRIAPGKGVQEERPLLQEERGIERLIVNRSSK
jgi:hypothetical protein